MPAEIASESASDLIFNVAEGLAGRSSSGCSGATSAAIRSRSASRTTNGTRATRRETYGGDLTHRLTSVVGAHQIVVLSHGRIVEQGTHDELLARKGVYQRLWEQQSGFAISSDGRRAAVTRARLRAVAAFASMDEDVLSELASCFGSEHHPAGATVLEEGDRPSCACASSARHTRGERPTHGSRRNNPPIRGPGFAGALR